MICVQQKTIAKNFRGLSENSDAMESNRRCRNLLGPTGLGPFT